MYAQRIKDQLSDLNPDAALFDDNMSAALIGIGYRGNSNPVAVYSRNKIIERLCSDGFTLDEAESYYISMFLNVVADENTPIIFYDCTEAE